MLPTPSKFHYVFNLRDLSRIWQGMLYATSDVIRHTSTLLALWKHEVLRVVADRFIEPREKDWLEGIVKQVHIFTGNSFA